MIKLIKVVYQKYLKPVFLIIVGVIFFLIMLFMCYSYFKKISDITNAEVVECREAVVIDRVKTGYYRKGGAKYDIFYRFHVADAYYQIGETELGFPIGKKMKVIYRQNHSSESMYVPFCIGSKASILEKVVAFIGTCFVGIAYFFYMEWYLVIILGVFIIQGIRHYRKK